MSFSTIAKSNPIIRRFGLAHPTSGRILTAGIEDMVELERLIYAGRFQTLASEFRDTTATGSDHRRPYRTVASAWVTAFRGLVLDLPPDVIPGSANVKGTTGGVTLAARGGLRCRVFAEHAEVRFGIRTVTLAGSYGQGTTYGLWNWSTFTESAGTFTWGDVVDDATSVADHCLYPSGIAPGDTYEYRIDWRLNTGAEGRLAGWVVWEPNLTSVAP